MSHGDRLTALPPGLSRDRLEPQRAARGDRRPRATICSASSFTPRSRTRRAASSSCARSCSTWPGSSRRWTPGSFVDEAVAAIAGRVGPSERVICGLSGGVDSSVAAVLCHRALGDRLGVHLRRQRPAPRRRVRERGAHDAPELSPEPGAGRRARAFLDGLAGVSDPEQKRKDHRPRVHRGLRGARRHGSRTRATWSRARSIRT